MTEPEDQNPPALIVYAGVASATGGTSGETEPGDNEEPENGVDS